MQDVDEGVAAALGIDRNRGTLIRSVTPAAPPPAPASSRATSSSASPASRSRRTQTLAYLISQQAIGARVPVEVIRQGQRRTVTVAIAERPTEEELARLNGVEDDGNSDSNDAGGKPSAPTPSAGQRSAQAALGLALEPLTPAMARQLNIRDANVHGLVVGTVDPNSDAGQKGVQAGDIILSINQQPTATPEAAAAIVDAARRAGRNTVLLQVKRGNNPPAYIGVDLVRAAAPARPAPAPAH
jgi:serine protease Do